MSSLIAQVSNGADKRRADDFYPTPREATVALLPLIAHWPKTVWEPACGDGAMARVLEAAGFDVFASDLVDRGFGTPGIDFVRPCQPPVPPRNRSTIITNPPFKLAAQFVLKADALCATQLAMLLKANFWNAAGRLHVWDAWPPYAVHPLTWRLDFTGAGSPHTDCAWFLWDRTSPPLARPLARPAPISAEEMLA